MYRSSEFSYLTGTEKIVNLVDTAAVVVILAALIGPAGTVPLSVVRATGWYLSGKNVVLWLMGVDVNGDKLTAKQREELLGRIAEDVILALTIWGLGKIYRRSLAHIDLDVVDDVDDALEGTGEIFKSPELLDEHYVKHGAQFKKVFNNPSYSAADYLDDANHVIKNGEFVPEMNGYVKFVGGEGSAKYAFVGLDRATGEITTFHLKTVSELSKKAPSLGLNK